MLGIGAGAPQPEHPAAFETIALRASSPGLAGVAARGLAALSARRFDVVLGADWVSGALGLAWRGRSSVRQVFAAVHDAELDRHALRAARPIGGVYRKSRQLVFGRFDGLLTLSPRSQTLLDDMPGARPLAIGRGCDPDRFRPLPRGALAREHGLLDRRVLASSGPLVPERCIDKVLFAVSALGVRYPDLCYVVAGDGPERHRLELLAERLRIPHKVRFLGAVPDAAWPEVFNLCDVFVHLTSGSARPVDMGGAALIEAQACAKPLVVTAQAAAEEGVDEQMAAIVPEDDSTALAEALSGLLDDPARARRLGEHGRQRVLVGATWDLAAERLLGAITRVARRPRDEHARATEAVRQRPSRAGAALVQR
ncbi:MAG TPA: glycosyltransferase [Polyangiaceae bacterium]|nr:glycosyltransferase [Polyangiaceae bacterium]